MEAARVAPLRRMNPSMKLLALAVLTVPVSFAYDPYTPACVLLGGVAAILALGGIRPSALLRATRPFLLLGAGFTFFTILSRGTGHDGPLRLFFLSWRAEDLTIALSLGLRIVAVAVCSVGFVMTTDPVELMLSLIGQLHVPYIFGYATLAAYRFLPTFSAELDAIRLAQEIRGVEKRRGLFGAIGAFRRYAIPLLAQTVRRGERVALAMEGRAFGAYPERTQLRDVRVRPDDWIGVAAALAFMAATMICAAALGVLRLSAGSGLG